MGTRRHMFFVGLRIGTPNLALPRKERMTCKRPALGPDWPWLKSRRTTVDPSLTTFGFPSPPTANSNEILIWESLQRLNEILYVRPFLYLKHTENFQLISPVTFGQVNLTGFCALQFQILFANSLQILERLVISISSTSLILPVPPLTAITLFICKWHCQSLGCACRAQPRK